MGENFNSLWTKRIGVGPGKVVRDCPYELIVNAEGPEPVELEGVFWDKPDWFRGVDDRAVGVEAAELLDVILHPNR